MWGKERGGGRRRRTYFEGDVGVADWGVEFDLRRGVRVCFWDEEGEVPLAVCFGGNGGEGGEVSLFLLLRFFCLSVFCLLFSMRLSFSMLLMMVFSSLSVLQANQKKYS